MCVCVCVCGCVCGWVGVFVLVVHVKTGVCCVHIHNGYLYICASMRAKLIT